MSGLAITPQAGHAGAIARRILSGSLKSVYRGLSARQHHSIRAALRLMTAVVSVSPVLAKETLQQFDFTLKALPKHGSGKNAKNRSNIRGCYIRFVCSFLRCGDLAVVGKALELRNFMLSLFSSADLTEDRPASLMHLLDTILDHVVRTPLQRRAKIGLISSKTLVQVRLLLLLIFSISFFSPFFFLGTPSTKKHSGLNLLFREDIRASPPIAAAVTVTVTVTVTVVQAGCASIRVVADADILDMPVSSLRTVFDGSWPHSMATRPPS